MIRSPYAHYEHRPVVGGEVDWSGYWLTSKRFAHLPYSPRHEYTRRPEYATETKNIHTLFRKNFETKKGTFIARALLYITGDDIYKAYINSSFIGEGPAQSFPYAYNYNCFDVTSLIIAEGMNALGVHVYYQGMYNISLVSADNLHGMIAELHIEYGDGSKEKIVSDSTWRCKESEARSAQFIFGYQTQFSENIDMNKWESDWYSLSCDLSLWDKVHIPGTPYPGHYSFIPQLTPPVRHEMLRPVKTKKVEGGYLFDFGKEYTGTLLLSLKGEKGSTAEVRCGEELDDEGRVRFSLRAGCRYQEFITLSGESDLVDFYEYKGFRYAEVITSAEFDPESIILVSRHYPFPERPASFSSSDKLLNDIWDICAHGVKVGTHDTYLDCPTREKGGFLGDAIITGITHLALTGDIRILKKLIYDCANSARFFRGVICHVPTYVLSVLADYSFLVPIFLEEYYNYTADASFVKEMLPMLFGIIDHYSVFENEKHLLENIRQPLSPASAILVDWPVELRDGYEFDKADAGVCTEANVFYYGCLKKTSQLCGIAGDKDNERLYREKYETLGRAIISETYDEKAGLFKDTPDTDHFSLHGNALQLYYGLTPPKGYGPIVELIRERRLNCGVYFAYFIIKGLYNIGENDLAYDLITGKDIHSWYHMLQSGATTCMEAWGPEQKWNTSWCHPWSSSPIHFIAAEIMGIKPSSPGWLSVRCSPKIPDGIDRMELEMPVATGRISASFLRPDTSAVYTLTVPEGVNVIFDRDPDSSIEFVRSEAPRDRDEYV